MHEEVGGEKLSVVLDSEKEKRTPVSWRRSEVIFLLKKDVKSVDRSDFRPISVMKTSYKLFGKIMGERLTEFADKIRLLREEQSGFMKGRQLEETIAMLCMQIEKAKRGKKSLFLASVDLRKT